MKKIYIITGLLLAFLSVQAQDFVKREGKLLKFHGDEIYLRGMAFNNLVYDDNLLPSQHHSEVDYRRVRDLGMNAIRFYMNYKTFEDDAAPYQYKQSGWDWIDQNIKWAKNHGIFLILNIHIPQGGFQSRCEGDKLWTIAENQKRLAALWKAIAEKYKDEPQIAGFDILNEPTPTETVQKWTDLAQAIIDSIRTVDNNHLIVTERAIALDCNYNYADEHNNYPQISEENLMYTVHLYDPFEFTHQNLPWSGIFDGGKYPDPKITVPPDATLLASNNNNPTIKPGTNDWTYFQGVPFTVTDPSIILGKIILTANKINGGKVYYDDFELKELDEQGNLVRTIYSVNPTSGSYWWRTNNATGYFYEEKIGHNDNYSVSASGSTFLASIVCASLPFRVKKGHQYVISGWMKGVNVPADASASITTEFYYSPSKADLGVRDYQFLAEKITSYSKYIEDKGFPVYFGEFGAARTCFVDDKGGDRWVADVLRIFDSLDYHFTYHAYKESSFGLYDGLDKPVDTTTVNTALESVFKNFFGITTDLFSSNAIEKSSLMLYPNPGSDLLNIDNSGNKHVSKVEVCDMLGNVLLSSEATSGMSVLDLPKGSYIVLLHCPGGVVHRKWVKQ